MPLLLAQICYSQTTNHVTGEEKLGTWYSINGSYKLSDRFSLKSDVEIRTYEAIENFNVVFLSLGASYKLKKNISAGGNYVYLILDNSFVDTDNPNTTEHRFNEQIGMTHTLNNFTLKQRLRVEHRFMDNTYDYEQQHRIRYRFLVKYPISNVVGFSISDELFYNLDQVVFQQNRLIGKLNLKLLKKQSVYIGFMKQHFTKISFNRLLLGLSIKTDWRKGTKD